MQTLRMLPDTRPQTATDTTPKNSGTRGIPEGYFAHAPLVACLTGEINAATVRRRHEMRVRGDRRLRRAVATVLFVNAFLVFVLQPHISKRYCPCSAGAPKCGSSVPVLPTGAAGGIRRGLLRASPPATRLARAPCSARHRRLATLALQRRRGAAAWCIAAALDLAGARRTTGAALHRLDGDVAPAADGRRARRAECGSLSVVRREQCGSLAGLFAYPLLVEPLLTLDAQARAWSAGALVLLAMLALTGSGLVGSGAPTTARDVPSVPGPTARQRVRWLVLSLVPSVLLLAVTAQITTDIAPIPLLWTLPLGIYLASFIRVFSQGWQPSRWTWTLLAVFSLPMLLAFAFEPNQWFWVGVHLAILWCGAVLCHGALVQERPASNRLAEFYVWLAMGGALGGLLAGIVAPLVFDMRAEYPLAVLAVLWLAPPVPTGSCTRAMSWRIGLGLAVIGVVAATGLAWATAAPPGMANVFVLVPSVAAVVSLESATRVRRVRDRGAAGDRGRAPSESRRHRAAWPNLLRDPLRPRFAGGARTRTHAWHHSARPAVPPSRTPPRSPSYYGPNSPLADVLRGSASATARTSP